MSISSANALSYITWTTFLATIFFTCGLFQNVAGENDIDSWVDKGIRLSDSGKYEEAIELYDKALEINPDHINALNNKGFALYNLGRYEEAIVIYDKALEKEPDNVGLLINKGAALLDSNKFNQVIDVNDKVLDIDPNNIIALSNKASAIDSLGRYQDAIILYDKVLDIDPNDINALNNKGVSLHHLGKYSEAIGLYDMVLKINSDDVDASRNKELAQNALNMNSGSSSPSENSISGTDVSSSSESLENSTYLQYENSTYGIKLQYPSDWTTESGNSSAEDEIFSIIGVSPPISSDPNANTFLDIGYDSSVQANDFNLDEYVRGVIETLKTDNEISDFKVESVKTDAMLANKPAYSLVTTNTADSTAMKSLEVGTLVAGKLYYMLFSTEESKFNSFLPDIQKMIDSFELVSEKGASLNENDKTTVANTTESQSENEMTTDANTTESEIPSPEVNSNKLFQSYENPKYGISIQYPSNWTPQSEESNSADDTFQLMINAPITSNGLSYVVIGHDPSIEGENISLEKYVDDTVKGIKEEGIFNVESVKTDAMISGRQAYSIELTNTGDETDRKSLEVGTLVGNKLYRILFDAAEADYNTLLPDAQRIIDSFEIIDRESDENKQNVQNVSSVISPSTFSGNQSVTSEQIENTNESLTAGSSESTSQKFTTMMSGDEEVPQVDTDASAIATLIPLEGVVKYVVNVTGISKATEAHIHLGNKGENGYTVVDLLEGGEQTKTENGMTIMGNITDMSLLVGPLGGLTTADLIHLMNGGGIDFMAGPEAGEFKHLYVNVHTENHPDGEIRGQIS